MNRALKLFAAVLAGGVLCSPVHAATPPVADDSALRQQLVKTLLSEGDEQQTNLNQLGRFRL